MVAQQFDGVKDVDFLLQFHLLPNTADRCVQTTLRRTVPKHVTSHVNMIHTDPEETERRWYKAVRTGSG